MALIGVALLAAGALGWQFVRGRASEAPAAAAPGPDPALVALDHLADSVSMAVRVYARSEQQFAARQIDCPALAEGLVLVEDLWASYNIGKRRVGTLDVVRLSRYQTLDASVDSVDRDFDRSGCPRP
jgi:hypothetical protein